jgi:hypothetical protein
MSSSWDQIHSLGSVFNVRFSYTGFGDNTPPPPADVDANTRMLYTLSLPPPVPAEVTTEAITFTVLSEEEVIVLVVRPLLLNYTCGPTTQEHSFVLRHDGSVGYIDTWVDHVPVVRTWTQNSPTWELVAAEAVVAVA